MSKIDKITWCVGCGTEISWTPIIEDEHYYCCQDCANGLFCKCGYEMELDDSYPGESSQSQSINIESY